MFYSNVTPSLNPIMKRKSNIVSFPIFASPPKLPAEAPPVNFTLISVNGIGKICETSPLLEKLLPKYQQNLHQSRHKFLHFLHFLLLHSQIHLQKGYPRQPGISLAIHKHFPLL